MPRTTMTFSVVVFCLLLVASSINAQLDFAVKLKTGEFTPSQLRFSASRAASYVDQHVLIQFDHMLTDAERRALENEGIELLSYVPNYAYTARLRTTIDQATADQFGIRWLDGIDPLQKISPDIDNMGIRETSRRLGDQVQFTVVLHKDEDIQQWSTWFEQNLGATVVGPVASINAVELIMPEDGMYVASEQDGVVWIEQASPPPVVHNGVARVATGTAAMEEPPFNLTGAGVKIVEWDGGAVDVTHADFSDRAFSADGAAVHYHATHVAGTLIGTGFNSGGEHKGMATEARLMSFLWWTGNSELEAEYTQAMLSFGARISSNSWGLGVGDPATESACQNLMGAYYSECAILDNIVRGDANSRRINIFWSAGNERGSSSKYCGSLGWTYNTVGPYATAKNIITVGAIGNGSDAMTGFSSWGPVDDGRIKPDIVGPGCAVISTMPGGGYAGLCGTSMSCPASAGTVALLVEHVKNTYGADTLWPSTYKAVVINSAVDLGPVGPDYQFGHGKIDGEAAAHKIDDGEGSFVQREISTGEVHTYDITHTGQNLKVTLVWDDPGAHPASSVQLVNDIDLKLVDPWGVEHHPWVLNPLAPSISASTGEDHINNVETVEPVGGSPGLWRAIVTGFNIPDGPQGYSLVFTPDSAHQPGNTYALAVFDSEDAIVDPGANTTVDFTVANVGDSPDSVQIEIFDHTGWMTTPVVDTSIWLSVYDSVLFTAGAAVPAASFAGDNDTLYCRVTSILNPGVVSTGKIVVEASAYYGLTMATTAEDTVASPESYSFDLMMENTGNAVDVITLSISQEQGWLVVAPTLTYVLQPKSDSTISIAVNVPAEVTHLTENLITIGATTNGNASDNTTHNILVYNPYPPPALTSPDNPTYVDVATPEFVWEDNGDSYSLFIASDDDMTPIERSYLGITTNSFVLPPEDELPDGPYWWAVRRFVGADSSSLQAQPYKFVIDRQAPNPVTPLTPVEDNFVSSQPFNLTIKNSGGSSGVESAPEFNRIELSQVSDFSSGVIVYDSIFSNGYNVTDQLAQERWYWRTQRYDLAGNVAPMSAAASFIIDSEKPHAPDILAPMIGDTVDTDDVVLRWSDESPPPDSLAASVYYWLQMSTSEYFSNTVWSGNVYADSMTFTSETFDLGASYYWRVRAIDSAGHSSGYQTTATFLYAPYTCADPDGSGVAATPIDLSYLVDFLFSGGPSPIPMISGSMDCDESVDPVDLAYLVDFLFAGGPEPCCP